MIWIHLIILSAPLFTLPIFLLKKTTAWQLKFAAACSVITILGLGFGIYGRLTSGLLIYQFFPDFDQSHHQMLSQRIQALGLFATWGSSYPLMVLIRSALPRLREQSYFANTLYMLTYFYSMQFVFSAIGIFILWIYL